MKMPLRFKKPDLLPSERPTRLLQDVYRSNLNGLSWLSLVLMALWLILATAASRPGDTPATGFWPVAWPAVAYALLAVLPRFLIGPAENWRALPLRIVQGKLAALIALLGLAPFLTAIGSKTLPGDWLFLVLALSGAAGLTVLPLIDALAVVFLPLIGLALILAGQSGPASWPDLLTATLAGGLAIVLSRQLTRLKFRLHASEQTAAACQSQLEALTERDSKSALYNESATRTRLALELARAARYQHPLSLLIFEIDGLSVRRRSLGSAECDRLVAELAERLNRTLRTTDILGYTTNDHFLVILPDTPLVNARIAAVRILAMVEIFNESLDLAITLNCGLSQFQGETLESLLLITEARMYQARKIGSNQVVSD
jgi:diguanylate cyclase (GGDEF)-like protein